MALGPDSCFTMAHGKNLLVRCCVVAVSWCHMEGVDTCEQGDQNPIGLYSGREPDRVARGDNIFHRPNKETTITEERADVFSPCRAAGVSARRALLTPVPRRSRYGADAVAALASPPPAAESAILRHAGLGAGAAVTILSRPAAFAVTLPTVTRPMAYKT